MSILCSCGNNSKPQVDEQAIRDSIEKAFKDSIAQVEAAKAKQDSIKKVESSVALIKNFYQYVFGKKDITDQILKKFLTESLMQSLWTEDYEGCYEYWKFRTIAQDYDEKVGNVSKIEQIDPLDDDWYSVSYLDMGYKGQTKVKVNNGKIVDYKPDKSWNN